MAHEYQISKYEVTIGQYTEFLNAKAASDPYGLYNPHMAANSNIAGISRSGISGSYTYSVIGSSNRPVTYVSWFDTARFSNWMHNGQGSGDTETGAYALHGATSGVSFSASASASYRLPTEDEWYKAAYYDPTKDGTGGYWLFPTLSNTLAGNTPGAGANRANYHDGDLAVTQSDIYSPSQNYLTSAGAYSGSASYYGTFDQGGNVWEWNDAVISGSSRGLRGGAWTDNASTLQSSSRLSNLPTLENFDFGFRLATVPEPSSVLMVGLAGLALLTRRRRPTL